jgi:histidine triad (HIT) family protein
MNEPSIFTKIIRGEIPCHKIYEDDKTLAFLDIHPVAEGHTLVIPKTEVEFLWDLSDEDYQAVMATAKKVALHLRKVVGKPYVGEMVVGTDVPHAHVHIVPFTVPSELKRTLNAMEDTPVDHTALAKLAEKLRFS